MANQTEKLTLQYYDLAWENLNEKSALKQTAWQIHRFDFGMIRTLDFFSYLDSDCGERDLLKEIYFQQPPSEVCSVVFSPREIEIARWNNPGINNIQRNSTYHPRSIIFTLVTCMDTQIHEDDKNVIQNPQKMAGKRFLLVSPNGRSIIEGNLQISPTHGYPKEKVTQNLHQANFQIIRKMEWGLPIFTLYRQKILHLFEEITNSYFNWKKRVVSSFLLQIFKLILPFESDRFHALCYV